MRSLVRQHLLVEVSPDSPADVVRMLNERGVRVVRPIPDDGFIVWAWPQFDRAGLGLKQVRPLTASDKISAEIGSDLAPAFFLVEFHPDVDDAAAREAVWNHGFMIHENPDVLPGQLVIEGPPAGLDRLADADEVTCRAIRSHRRRWVGGAGKEHQVQPYNYISRIAGELGIILLACCGAASADSGAATKMVYTISTLYGGGSNGDGSPAIQAILTQPEGIAVDMKGNVYIADAADDRVRRTSPDGMIQTIAGTGVAGFSGDGGPAENAQLNTRYGLCPDTSGNLYIADLSNARVRRISNDGTISTFAGGGTVLPGGNGPA